MGLRNVFWVFPIMMACGLAFGGEPPASTPELLTKGKVDFKTNCVVCHGEKGDGMGDAGKYLVPKPRNFATDKFKKGDSLQEVFTSITKGIDGTAMVGFPNLPEEDRWALAYYVKSFRK